jgi:hypothetical protein
MAAFSKPRQRFGAISQMVKKLLRVHENAELWLRQGFHALQTLVPEGIEQALIVLQQVDDAGSVYRSKRRARRPP